MTIAKKNEKKAEPEFDAQKEISELVEANLRLSRELEELKQSHEELYDRVALSYVLKIDLNKGDYNPKQVLKDLAKIKKLKNVGQLFPIEMKVPRCGCSMTVKSEKSFPKKETPCPCGKGYFVKFIQKNSE